MNSATGSSSSKPSGLTKATTVIMPADDTLGREKRKGHWVCCGTLLCLASVMILILLPISFKTVEYYNYGLLRKSSTGKMKLNRIYTTGRYFVGPDFNFKYFQADAHFADFKSLSVFSADRLECLLDIDLIYYINKTELIKLHNTYERAYRQVVDGRVQDAIKNTAPKFTTAKYFTEREAVQAAFFEAVKERLREVFCYAEEMYLQLVTIPDEVAARQLKTAVQLENNIKEKHTSEAVQIRQQTSKLVNDVNNNATLIIEQANADAALQIAVAEAQSRQITAKAQSEGLAYMYKALNVTTDEHKSSLDYIRTLRTNPSATINVGYSTKISTFEEKKPAA